MKKNLLPILIFILLLLPLLVFAQVSLSDVSPLKGLTGTEGIATVIGRIIKGFLGMVGAIALLMFVYGGFLMLASGGKSEEISKGKNVLVWATLGLVVIFTSYILTEFAVMGISMGVRSTGGGISGFGPGEDTTSSPTTPDLDKPCASVHGTCRENECKTAYLEEEFPSQIGCYAGEKCCITKCENVPQLQNAGAVLPGSVTTEGLPESVMCQNACNPTDLHQKDYTALLNVYCPGIQKCCGTPKAPTSIFVAQTCLEACTPFIDQQMNSISPTPKGSEYMSMYFCAETAEEDCTSNKSGKTLFKFPTTKTQPVYQCSSGGTPYGCCCQLYVYGECSDRHPGTRGEKWECTSKEDVLSFPWIQDAIAVSCGGDQNKSCWFQQ